MITKITNTPMAVANLYSKNDCCKPRKQNPLSFNSALKADTVSFTSSHKQVEDIMALAFDKLNKVRKNGQLATYFGTTKNNVNIAIRETVYGKEAELTLSDGKFGGNSFANFELKRNSQKPAQILSENQDAKLAAKIIKTHLEDLK